MLYLSEQAASELVGRLIETARPAGDRTAAVEHVLAEFGIRSGVNHSPAKAGPAAKFWARESERLNDTRAALEALCKHHTHTTPSVSFVIDTPTDNGLHFLPDDVWDQLPLALVEAALEGDQPEAEVEALLRGAGVTPDHFTAKIILRCGYKFSGFVAAIIAAADHPLDPVTEIQMLFGAADVVPESIRAEVEVRAA